jgi:3-dehydroquinate synthase
LSSELKFCCRAKSLHALAKRGRRHLSFGNKISFALSLNLFAFVRSRISLLSKSHAQKKPIVKPVTISTRAGKYDVLVGSKLLHHIGTEIAKKLEPSCCAIISDENVATRFAPSVSESLKSSGFEPTLLTVPPGEKSKSLEQVSALCQRMVAAASDRMSFVVALGGGVVGDLAGFVAAIFHRGIPWVQLPTTLLAQVDSSIGGKTAVNIPAGKNLIGALHHPVFVIADVDLLQTLPQRELNQGFAEIIKHGIIRDPALFDLLESFEQSGDLPSLVRRNVEIKAEFVAADERDETGERALLNFGHTVGHAIERAGDYCEVLHGEAVSLGIVAACDISVRKAGFPEHQRAKVIDLLRKFRLPTQLPANIIREKILRALPLDKKFERGKVRFVVASKFGCARLTSEVTMQDISEAIDRL